MTENVYDRLVESAAFIAERSGREQHQIGVVLGSGLSGYATTLPLSESMPFSDVPGFPLPGVEGHSGALVSAEVSGANILVAAGRVHAYEGLELDDVVYAARVMALSGCRIVVLTNAAGGVGEGLAPGDIVAIRDHLNLTGRNPLAGANDSRLGPRFPDLSDLYSADLRTMIGKVMKELGEPFREGVYAWFSGPSYETPAEVQMARILGADLVGMSTVPEAIALAHMGVQVAGLSLVTNLAAGIQATPLSHEEVTEVAAAARVRLERLLDGALAQLAATF